MRVAVEHTCRRSLTGRVLPASSQSLLAMYALQQAGFTNLTHVEGGFSSYTSARLPMDNDDE